MRYLVRIKTPSGTGYYLAGTGRVREARPDRATRFPGYADALEHLAGVLRPGDRGLEEPAEITITVDPESVPPHEWTVQEILDREG
jgi:hypothetical protein